MSRVNWMLLSTIIITKNCARTLDACLQSVKGISDEIIILDSQSVDDTRVIAERYTHKFIQSTDWPGFGVQKQRALDLARGTWVLSIDADEVLTPECQQEIQTAIQHKFTIAYRIKRLMIFAGKAIHHSGCSDAPIRLFKKAVAKFTPDIIHEYVIVQGTVGKINSPMLHYSYANIGEWIAKMNLYSELGAQKKADQKKYSVTYAIFSAMISFIKMYIFKKGILDGRLGLVASINSAVASYYKYLKLALDKDFNKKWGGKHGNLG